MKKLFAILLALGLLLALAACGKAGPAPEATQGPVWEGPTLSPEEFWGGKWYGWAVISAAGGKYENDADARWDVCAEISPKGEDWHIVIYAIDASPEQPDGEADLIWLEGGSDYGRMMSLGGSFLSQEVEETGWLVDPRHSPVCWLRDMICISGQYGTEQRGDWFAYSLFLRPWGIEWDPEADAASAAAAEVELPYPDMMPAHYFDWYLPQLKA